MTEHSNWLPELVLFEDYDGDWERYVEAVYLEFWHDWVNNAPADFLGKRVGLKRHPLLRGKEATFWHFTSEGEIEEERLPELRRCERIRWPRAMLDAFGTDRVKY